VVRDLGSLAEEIKFTVACLEKWHEQGIAWGDMAVLYASNPHGKQLAAELKKASLPHLWMAEPDHKSAYRPGDDKVSLLTIHSSKGLEFPRVIIVGASYLKYDEEQKTRLLYVGMTRAMECLLITASAKTEFGRKLLAVAAQ